MTFKKALVIALLFLAACKKSSDAEVVPTAEQDQQATGDVGPFTVDFQGTDQVYSHSVKGLPKQDEGKLEYYITVSEKSKVTLVSSEVKVTGCPASQVSDVTFWLPDATKTEGTLIMPGLSFQPTPGVKGSFMHVLKGLNGCTEVGLTTSLKREKISAKPNPSFPVGGTCEGTSTSDQCQVQAYCRESYASGYYVEVEAWKYPWGLMLQKYMHHDDGTRGLMSSETATMVGGSTSTTYSGANTSLNYNNTSGVGYFTEDVSGQPYTTDLDCTYL